MLHLLTKILLFFCYPQKTINRVSLLQPTTSLYQNFSNQIRERAEKDYNYSFYEGEEVRKRNYDWNWGELMKITIHPIQVNFFIGKRMGGNWRRMLNEIQKSFCSLNRCFL